MKVYVIKVINNHTNRAKVSQEGYTTLEAAQAFVECRYNNPVKENEWEYHTTLYDYEIVEVSIKWYITTAAHVAAFSRERKGKQCVNTLCG